MPFAEFYRLSAVTYRRFCVRNPKFQTINPKATVLPVQDEQVFIEHLTAAAAAAEQFLHEVRAVAVSYPRTAQAIQHGFAWIATYTHVLTQNAATARRLAEAGRLGAIEQNLLAVLFGEYLAQLLGGLPLSQNEMVRPSDFGLDARSLRDDSSVRWFLSYGNVVARRARVADFLAQEVDPQIDDGLDDTHQMIRSQFYRFAQDKVVPYAHDWHLNDALIPRSVIDEMAMLGVFGLTISEDYGGLGLDKVSMCVVTEELSRGFIGVGSLGTRTEIASELIIHNGSEAQKAAYLPGLARGDILPTAVFTEPDIGSDLAHLKCRAVRREDDYLVDGAKTWITHAARANLMTLLVRTMPETDDHNGLSMLLASKPSSINGNDFPVDGLTGSEISVLGYRGMREYSLNFDGFRVSADGLLGGVEGHGFRQLMKTFESARIQTAARAIGVAQSAADAGLRYAHDRMQFGRAIFEYPRIADKLVMMFAEIMGVRQLTYHAARQKDSGRRCDLEAGMAKLLAARIAWSAADNAVQIHGGAGFAQDYPVSRILCDARILSIFEGTAEIQAEVIARRLAESDIAAEAKKQRT